MREIALDTETTGLSALNGDRITEIGCVEIIDKAITGETFHVYINPERDVGEAAQKISGLTYDFLKQHKKFRGIAKEFLDFIGDSRLIIHNAPFDLGFLNMELEKFNGSNLKNKVVDTLDMAKQKYPGSPATLDALCKKFSVNASKRIKHGALIDAELLAEVYIIMSVEFKQKDIFSITNETFQNQIYTTEISNLKKIELTETEKKLHNEFIKKIKNSIWEKYL